MLVQLKDFKYDIDNAVWIFHMVLNKYFQLLFRVGYGIAIQFPSSRFPMDVALAEFWHLNF